MSLTDPIDNLLTDAAALVIRYQQCSVPFIQRKFKITYLHAERITNQLEFFEIIAKVVGSREMIVLKEEE